MIKFILWTLFIYILGVFSGAIITCAVVVASKSEEENK